MVAPASLQADPRHPTRIRAFHAIPERDGWVLRLDYEQTGEMVRIITLVSGPRPEAARMKSKCDPETDALYLRFADAPVVESEEVRPDVMFDFDAEGRIVAIEVLDASEHLADASDLTSMAAAQ